MMREGAQETVETVVLGRAQVQTVNGQPLRIDTGGLGMIRGTCM